MRSGWQGLPAFIFFFALLNACGVGSDDCQPQSFSGVAAKRNVGESTLHDGTVETRVLQVGILATTLNLLYESGLEPIANLTRSERIPGWQDRKDNIVKIVMNYQPDLLAFQESTPFQAGCLQNQLEDYNFVYGEGLSDSLIAYRRDTFEELRRGSQRLAYPVTSWMPRFTALIPRGIAWTSLKHRLTGKSVFAAGVHLDNRNRSYQALRMHDVIAAQARAEDVKVLMGDMNIDASSEAFRENVAIRGFKDSFAEALDVREGKEGNKRTFILSERRIDHILFTGPVTVGYWEITRLPGSERYFSDHLPVTVRFNLALQRTGGND